MVSTSTDRGDKRPRLVKAATFVFAEKGYAATRVSDIADNNQIATEPPKNQVGTVILRVWRVGGGPFVLTTAKDRIAEDRIETHYVPGAWELPLCVHWLLERGGLDGIVTLEDLVEEVVGEVRDEFDLEKEPYVELAPGILEVAGDYLVDDLVEAVYLGDESLLPDVETVGGLVITQLGRPPKVNDEAVYNENVSFKVLDVDRRAVARVRIEFPSPDLSEEEQNDDASSSSRR